MSLEDLVATYLQTNGIGTVGTDIFVSRFTDTPDLQVAVADSGGRPPDMVMGPSDAIRYPRVIIGARSRNSETCKAKMEAIRALFPVATSSFGAVVILEPRNDGHDDNGRWHRTMTVEGVIGS